MYWISWNGSNEGAEDFKRRNFMNNESVPCGHILGKYVKDLVPAGKTMFNIPVADPGTAAHVARQLEEPFARGERIMLGMEDGVYVSDSPIDAELQANLFDKYFIKPVMTDPFMSFYNQVSRLLLDKHPNSNALIGLLAYGNLTLPPQRILRAEKPLVAYLAPIDIDPNHGMSDPRSPARQEYAAMMARWADVMQGRLAIYDYDQGMLVWRDIPNPSHMAFRDDVKHYRAAGILGIGTESRNAIATTFLNLHLRGQLMWNPDFDVDAAIKQFYQDFYGPIAGPMGQYWDTLFKAWEDTIVTEHEHMVIPAIYTPEVMAKLDQAMQKAEADGKNLADPYQRGLDLAKKMHRVLSLYCRMVQAAATEADYTKAGSIGKELIEARLDLAKMNPVLTTRVVGVAAEPTEPKGSPAWLPGEVKQYLDTAALLDGTAGKLVTLLPLEWAFRRDPNDTGLARGWGYLRADLTYWEKIAKPLSMEQRKNYPTTEWEMVRSDLYPQAQGVLHPDWQSFTGYLWYKADVTLTAEQLAGKTHVLFPGLFNECWLHVNGRMVAHRPFPDVWWLSDYAFRWDVDLSEHLKPGANEITVRCHNPHHFGGMFRRPLLYQPN